MPTIPSSDIPSEWSLEINRPRPRKSRKITPEGRKRLRAAAMATRPWEKSTGPRTPEGKAKAARNSRGNREGKSARELRAELAGVFSLINQMAATRRSLM